MPTPNLTVINVSPDARIYDERPLGVKPEAILLHHTGGTNSLRYLSTYHANPVSIHKLVPKLMPDGKPGHYQIVPDTHRAWHAGHSVPDWGDFSIGIEIENLGNGRDPYTEAQYETVAQIVAYNCSLYHIKDWWVKCHKDIAVPEGRKTDPDPTFNLNRMWMRVRQIRNEWPSGWPALWRA